MLLLTFLLFDVRHLHGKLNTHVPFGHHTPWIHVLLSFPLPSIPTLTQKKYQISNIIQRKRSQRNTPHQSHCFFFALHKQTPHKIYYMLHHRFHYYYYKHLFSVHIILAYIMRTWKLSHTHIITTNRHIRIWSLCFHFFVLFLRCITLTHTLDRGLLYCTCNISFTDS